MKLTVQTIFLVFVLCLTGCNPFKDYSVVNLMQEGLIWENGTTTYNLGDVGIGSIKSKTFVLTNKSNLKAISCQTPSITNSTDFTIDSTTCTSEMEPFASCEVVILASPQSQGLKDVNIVRSCDLDSNRMNPVTAATMNAILTNVVWSPLTNDFGAVAVAANTSEATFTLTNNGSTTPSSCSATSLSNTTDFEITQDTCGTNDLVPSATCTVKVKGHPQSSGLKTATLSRSCGVGGTVTTTSNMIKVTGTVVNLAWTPLTNSFGSVNVGSNSSTQIFTLNNSGNGDATGCSTPTISDTTNFTITANTCGTNDVTASGSCTLTVRANPTTAGLKSASISRTCSVGGTVSTTTNQITTTGTMSPNLAWTPLTNSFGIVNVGSNSSTQIFTLNNSGNGEATTCGLATLSNVTDFTITADSCGLLDVTVSGSCSVTVKANPASSGVKATTLSRTCSVGGTVSTTSNQITATGTTSPNLAWSLLAFDFGTVNVGSNSSTQVFTLNNSGNGPATGCSVPTISDTTNFTITADTCGTSDVSASGSCNITVRSNPTSAGAKVATISRLCSVGGTVSTTANQILTLGFVPALAADWQQQFGFSDLGAIRSGSISNTFSYYFRNTNNQVLTGCTSPALSNATDFTILSENCSTGTMNANSLCEVQLRANSVTQGLNSTNLIRTCNETSSVSISLTASGSSNASTVQISGSCILQTDGRVKCWGQNSYGQLGDGTITSRYVPVEVSNLTNAVYISAEIGFHACAALSDQTVKCWGQNDYGQLGDGTIVNRTVPVLVSGISNATQVTTGSNHSCALLNDQTVKCWGSNSNGQIGDGTVSGISAPTLVIGISNAVQLSASYSRTCALLSDQTIKCWGSNTNGELGNGTSTSTSTPVLVSGISTATQISSSGVNHMCALLSNQTVKCWGYNYDGVVGDGTTTNRKTPVLVSGITNATRITTWFINSCAVLSDQTMKCWGNNDAGRVGDGTTIKRTSPVAVVGISNVMEASNNCALLNNNLIKCWGAGGNSGDGKVAYQVVPVAVPGVTNATNVVMGQSGTCALLSDQTIKCWGSYTMLGDGTTTQRPTPGLVTGITNATAISAGPGHTCALLSDQTIKCWGNNSNGQLGDGTTTYRYTPVAVLGISNATQISMGNNHSCALLSDQTIKCWGDGQSGQIGDGAATSRTTPVLVSGITNATRILATNGSASCALLSDQTIMCWGYNGFGKLGDGTTTNRSTPVSVNGISNAINISGGDLSMCALLSDQSVKCWGKNDYGQIGNGTYTNSLSPTTVSGLTNVVQITASSNHVCALRSDQTAQCWGKNTYGQLGDGTTITRPIPVFRLSQNSISILGTGTGATEHQCYVQVTTGQVYCSGQNDMSQTGYNELNIHTISGQ
jgi:alpha-tubulin suppressor-like RCC1 family protein